MKTYNKAKKSIRVLVMDVDGTLTDGIIYMGISCEVFKAFNVKDGYAIHNILPSFDIIPVVITGRQSLILENRCRELNINYLYQNIANKKEKLDELLLFLRLSYENVAYIGDDINDLDCMKESGLVGCPCDAMNQIKALADFISEKPGGKGAVREFIEWLLKNDEG